MKRGAQLAIGVLVAVLGTAWITQSSEGRSALDDADRAARKGERVEAIALARRAAMARCPGCSAPSLAYARLASLAREAEAKGDEPTALAAWRATRAATLATVVVDPEGGRRTQADNEIARLEHRVDMAAAAAGGHASPAATEDRVRQALAAPAVPSTFVFVILALGGAVFALGAVRFARAQRPHAPDAALALAGILGAAAGVLFF